MFITFITLLNIKYFEFWAHIEYCVENMSDFLTDSDIHTRDLMINWMITYLISVSNSEIKAQKQEIYIKIMISFRLFFF